MDQQEVWNEILSQHDLSPERGSSPSWLSYGWKYLDTHEPFNYSLEGKTVDTVEAGNEDGAVKILRLMAKGRTLYASAKELGLTPSNAQRTLRRFKSRYPALFTHTPVATLVKGIKL